MSAILEIDNYAFPLSEPLSTALTPADRAEENQMNARDALETLRVHRIYPHFTQCYGVHTWQDWMMFVLPLVARYYAVDRNRVLSDWAHHYGPGILAEMRAAPMEDKYASH